eukprot:GILK01010488.1.p1 GENE.GILK01010488.1~~GILK01010488.1.p1  ORF type:complete len:481 (+),score=73.82 GILK01010488.1:202-1443(+)
MPADAEIISVAAFDADVTHGAIWAIAIHRPEVPGRARSGGSWLHIYGGRSSLETALWKATATDCQVLDLTFVPLKLTCTWLMLDGKLQQVFLLSGTDCRVHTYHQDPSTGRFVELTGSNGPPPLPELRDFPSAVVALDIKYLNGSRVVAAGCQNGYLQLSVTNTTTAQRSSPTATSPVSICSLFLDGPLSNVRLFSLRPPSLHGTKSLTSRYSPINTFHPALQNLGSTLESIQHADGLDQQLLDAHLLVGGAIGFASVYSNIMETALDTPCVLPESSHFDSVLCGHTVDLDFDGSAEVLVGTYSNNLLVYKAIADGAAMSTVQNHTSTTTSPCAPLDKYSLEWQKKFAQPIYSIDSGDFNNDGVEEIVMSTMYRVHVLQPNLETAQVKVSAAVDTLKQLKQLQQELSSLLSTS